MLKAHLYATEALARRAIAAIDTARHPDGTEQVTICPSARALARDPELRARCVEITLPDGTTRLGYRERRPAKTWAEPLEMQNGDWGVPYEARRLAAFADVEVVVDGVTVRIPRENGSTTLKPVELPNGSTVWRSVPDTPGAGRVT